MFVALAFAAGCATARQERSRDATVVVLPDTQYASCYVPETFRAQVEWVVREKVARNIAAVLHVGDVVEHPFSRAEWASASSAMRLLDGKIPYAVVPGNHDADANRMSWMSEYFSPDTMPWIAGVMSAGRVENSYLLVDIGPRTWLVVGLEFGPHDASVAWADAVLKAHAELPAVLLTHAYLDGSDGSRYSSPSQAGYPTGHESNDGETLWQKLVVPNHNVRLVLCGHHGVGRRASARPDGSLVHEVASDYQWWEGDWNGYGYLRLMVFDYDTMTIGVQTYSPTRGSYLTGEDDQFTLSFEP